MVMDIVAIVDGFYFFVILRVSHLSGWKFINSIMTSQTGAVIVC